MKLDSSAVWRVLLVATTLLLLMGTGSAYNSPSEEKIYYNMSNSFNDLSGNGYDGAGNGGITSGDITGIIGDATDFDGGDDYVDTGFQTSDTGLSISAKVNFDSWDSDKDTIAGTDGTSDNQGQKILRYDGSGNLDWAGYDGSYFGCDNIAVSDLSGSWHTVTGTYSSAGEWTLYVDGTQECQVTDDRDISSVYSWYLGARNAQGSAGSLFDGGIDEYHLYTEELNSTEVNYLADSDYSNDDLKTNSAPTFDSVSTEPDSWTLNSDVNVSANVSDSDGTVSSVKADVYEDGSQIVSDASLSDSDGDGVYEVDNLFTVDESEVTYKYELTATDNDGATSTYSETREVDFTAPRLDLISPESPTSTRTGLPLNYTVSDPNLDTSSCKYSKDGGTNFTLSNCGNTTIDYGTVGLHNLTVYASDTYNNTGKASKTIFVDIVNEIRAEDQGSGSPIQEFSVTLDNGTNTIGGTALNNSFNFNTSNVPKGDVNLTLKTSGYQVQTFQLNTDDSFSLNKSYELERSSITVNALDEQNLSEVKFDLEASNSSTVFDKDGLDSFSKDYLDFNGNFPTGDVKITIKASNGDYTLRNYFTEIDENSVISLTSYLLKSNEGIPVTVETYTQDQESLSNVMLTAQKQINGDYKQVSQAITSSDGSGSFTLDPDFQYKLIASKSGYSTFEGTFSPANYQYDPLKIQLGTGGRFNFSTRWETIDYKLEPQGRFLNQTNNQAEISWTVNDLEGDLSEFGIRLKNKTGGLIKTEYVKTSPSGGQVNLTINGSKYPNDQVFNVEGYFISSGEEFRVEKQYSFEKQWESGIFSLDKILNSTGDSLDSSQKGFIALIITGLIGAGFGSRLEKEGAGLIILAVLGMFTIGGWFPPAIFILAVFTLMGVYFR